MGKRLVHLGCLINRLQTVLNFITCLQSAWTTFTDNQIGNVIATVTYRKTVSVNINDLIWVTCSRESY